MLDTITYKIGASGGCSDEYTSNIIAENMDAPCDEEGNQFNSIESIVDHNNDARAMERSAMYTKNWRKKTRQKDNQRLALVS
jgi:hypothetical protein